MRSHLCCGLALVLLHSQWVPRESPREQEAPSPPQAREGKLPQLQGSVPPAERRPAATFAFGLEDGTPVVLRLTRELSSASDRAGDKVDFEIVDDVKVKDLVVIPKGGRAWATLTEVQKKRRLARGGKLGVRIDEVRLADGERIPLRAVKENKGGGHVGVMTGAIVASGILFFPAAPFFLFMHGKEAKILKGTAVTAYVNGDTELDEQKFAVKPDVKP
jgi:hypothetical protein